MIKVGDKVVISPIGKFQYRNERSNPHDVEGTLLSLEGWEGFCYYVDWGNGCYNSYRKDELELSSPCLENK